MPFTSKYNVIQDKRFPSWTDRILFNKESLKYMNIIEYNSENTTDFSDHKPVYL